MTYKVEKKKVSAAGTPADLYCVGFGTPAQNDQIVKDAQSVLDRLIAGDTGGELALINGPASLPVACVLAHGLGHRYAAIGVFDPKMTGYIVAVSHGAGRAVGDVIPASEVKD
jgi:CRISPR-associated protein Csx3